MAPIPQDIVTLFDLLEWRVARCGNEIAFTWLGDGEEDVPLRYGDLARGAKKVASSLSEVTRPGDRVMLLCPPGLEYVIGFFGCLYAGRVPVPAYPPRSSRSSTVRAQAADSGATAALTTTEQERAVRAGLLSGGRWDGRVLTINARCAWESTSPPTEWARPVARSDSLALLQYTSGSTGEPMGVMVSHANLLANCQVIHDRFGHSDESRGVIWLPPYHDMGLIGGILQPIFSGIPVTLLSPLSVLQRPARWLEAITRFRATVSGGPNFAYELCARKVSAADRERLDLRSWQVAFTGAEPVRRDTIERFAKAFARCGFKRRAFYPCYGLAESTLFVSGGREEGSDPTGPIVACGGAAEGHVVRIVDPERREPCAEGSVGEIWVSGPSVAAGYWEKPSATAEVFGARTSDGEGPYLRTGDLGFLRDGRVVVTGRRKDVIIIRGRNHYAHDLEATVERCHASMRIGGVAAFSVDHEGEEKIVVMAEVEPHGVGRVDDLQAILDRIRGAIAEHHDVVAHVITLVRVGGVLKTSSGKVRRNECRRAFLEGRFEPLVVRAAKEIESSEITGIPSAETLLALDVEARVNVVEASLASMIRARLGARTCPVEGHAPIVAWGLDSLALVMLQAECEERWGASIPLGVFFEPAATLRGIAIRVASSLAPRVEMPEVMPAAQGMSDGQRALWLLERASDRRGVFQLARAFDVRGRVDVSALRRAFAVLVSRHDSLRMCFPNDEGAPVAFDRGAEPDWFTEIDCRGADEKTCSIRLEQEAARPLDLTRGPLFRVVLFSKDDGENILLVIAHHIVVDFESVHVLLGELTASYAAEIDDGATVLPPAVAQYSEYAALEHTRHDASAVGRALEHFATRLQPGIPILDLGKEADRGDETEFRSGGRILFSIHAAFFSKIRAFARESRTTPYAVLVSAWAVLLHRLSRQRDLVVGCPTSCRGSSRFARTVGYFVNPLPLRFAFEHGDNFLSVVARTHLEWVSALEHRLVPFARVVDGLHIARNGARPVGFQTLVSMVRAPGRTKGDIAALALGRRGETIDPSGLALELRELPMPGAQVDLALVMVESRSTLEGALEYDATLFSERTAESITARFRALLDRLLDRPDSPLASIPLLSSDEFQTIVDQQSVGPIRPSVHEGVLDAWGAIVREHGERIAIEGRSQDSSTRHVEGLTYAEVDVMSNAIAHTLLARGLSHEERVGVDAVRGPETIIAMLGILKAGGVFVPLEPMHPPARRDSQLRAVGARFVLGCHREGVEWPDFVERLSVDVPETPLKMDVRVSPRSAAYVIFTSGSSGSPKGVVVEHRSLLNLAEAQASAFGISPGRRVLQYASFAFDASISEVFVTLLAGATLRLAPAADLLVGSNLTQTLDDVDVVTLPPSVLARLDPHVLPGLDVISAGEPCANALVARWAPGRTFLNAYGPTEVTVCATVARADARSSGSLIGSPLVNTRAYVLDAGLEPMPHGTVGELYVAGEGVARGYLNRPGLTAERFIPDPFAREPGARMYRTGDLARLRLDGALEFVGRMDRQTKIRGVRVEPGEVETALASHSMVRECAVVPRGTASGEKVLVAYVATHEPCAGVTGDLRAHLRTILPEAMVPSTFVHLEALPRTVSGKVDHAQLPDVNESARPSTTSTGTPLERLVAEVWRETIGVENVGLHESFFDVGGTSLNAAQVHARLQERLGRELALLDIFTHATVSELARSLERRDDRVPAVELRTAAERGRRTMALLRQSIKRGDRR